MSNTLASTSTGSGKAFIVSRNASNSLNGQCHTSFALKAFDKSGTVYKVRVQNLDCNCLTRLGINCAINRRLAARSDSFSVGIRTNSRLGHVHSTR